MGDAAVSVASAWREPATLKIREHTTQQLVPRFPALVKCKLQWLTEERYKARLSSSSKNELSLRDKVPHLLVKICRAR